MTRYKVYTIEKGLIETNFIDGTIRNLTWHREDGPAYIKYHSNGKVAYEEYWVNDKKHRLNGPACIYYNVSGTLINELYYINGMSYTKENYHKELLKLKVNLL